MFIIKLPACLFKMKIIGIILIFLLSMLIECYAGCSAELETITSSNGTVTSPNYPQDYDNSLYCTYNIKSPTGRPVALFFLDFNVGGSFSCGYGDYLHIQDGNDVDLGKVCGSLLPDPVLALSGHLVLRFYSTSVWRFRGFKALYNDSQDIVHIVKAGDSTIKSPNFPENYPIDSLHLYYIQSVQGLPMKIIFTSFDIQYSSSCSNAFVLIKEGIAESANRIGSFCGDVPPLIPVVHLGILFMVFSSNQRNTRTGFSAVVYPILDCSGHLNVSHGIIQSPNYPNWNEDYTDCTYRLSNPNSYSIEIRFTDFCLKDSEDCEDNFVEIRTPEEDSERLCGCKDVPFNWIIASNSTLFYHHKGQTATTGFIALFNEITESTLTTEQYSGSSRSISSATVPVSTTIESSISAVDGSTTTNETSVPIIIGSVAGFFILASLTSFLIIWYLRKRSKRNRKTAFSNRNYNIQFTSAPETDSVAYTNVDARYRDVENKRSKTYADDPDYDVAAEIGQEHIEVINNVSDEQEGDYFDQEDSYNILNVRPKKSETTENYDRTTEGVYDSAKRENNDMDIGLYDHTPNSPDHEYDSTVINQPRVDDVYN